MDKPAGYNPMRWDCEKRGCFNKLRRPKLEMFATAFPGKINFGDVDGIVEINGNTLLLEWKTDTDEPRMGQRIMYERITRNSPATVFLVVGDAETMVISKFGKFHAGKFSPLKDSSFDDVISKMGKWATWASTKKPPDTATIESLVAKLAGLFVRPTTMLKQL